MGLCCIVIQRLFTCELGVLKITPHQLHLPDPRSFRAVTIGLLYSNGSGSDSASEKHALLLTSCLARYINTVQTGLVSGR
jgi:hypothetical protein